MAPRAETASLVSRERMASPVSTATRGPRTGLKVPAVLRDCSCVSAPPSSVARVGKAGRRAPVARMATPATRPTAALAGLVDSGERHPRYPLAKMGRTASLGPPEPRDRAVTPLE